MKKLSLFVVVIFASLLLFAATSPDDIVGIWKDGGERPGPNL